MSGSSRTKRVAVNAAANYIRFFLNIVISFLLIPYIIEQLGQEMYGLWTLSFSVIGFLTLLDFGFGLGVVKWSGEARVTGSYDHRNRLLSTVFSIYLAIAAAGMLILLLFSLFYGRAFAIPGDLQRTAVLVLIILGGQSIAVQIPMSMFKGVLFGEQRIALVNAVQILRIVLYGASAWLLLGRGMGIIGLAMLNLAATFAESVCYLVLAFMRTQELRISLKLVRRIHLKEAVSFSFYSFITTVAALVLFNTDSLIIQLTMNLTMVGIYGVALKICQYMLMLTKQLVNVLTPLISELKEKREEQAIRYLLLDLSRYITATGVMITGSIYVFYADLLRFWVGEEFLAAGVPLLILCTAIMLSIPELTASNVLTMTGHHKFTAKVSVSSIIVNITVSLLLVGPLGLTGIALGTLASSFINSTLITLGKAARVYRFAYREYLKRVFLPVLLPLPLLVGTGAAVRHYFAVSSLWDMMGKALPGVAVYLAVFWLVGVSRESRARILARISRRRR